MRAADIPFWIGTVWLSLLLLVTVFVDLLPVAPYDAMVGPPRQGPQMSAEFLGTDQIGRSVLSRALHGARSSMVVGLVAAAIGVSVGGLLGLLAGYFRGAVEAIVDILAEIVLAFPPILFLIALAAAVRPSLTTLTVSLALLLTPSFARMTKGSVIAQADREFVVAAKAMGASHRRVLFREILPNTLMSMLAFSVIVMALLIVIEGSLSFLGYGMPMPYPSWGSMVAESKDLLATNPSLVLIPVFFLFMTVYSLNIVGDHLRRRFDADAQERP